MLAYLLYLIVGAVGGLLIGLVGGGIGPIVVPTLLFLLNKAGVEKSAAVHLAVGTSLAIVLVTTTISISGFQLGKLIQWPLLKRLLPGTLLGALAGSVGSALLSGVFLQIMFGIFLIIVAILTLKIKGELSQDNKIVELPSGAIIFICTVLLSAISTILGVSDGLLLVPFLRRYQLPMRDTIATATVCAFSASVAGLIPYLLIGAHATNLPPNSFGFIYVPAFILIGIASCTTTPIGVYLNKILPEKKLKSIFSYFLMIIGLKMMFI